MLLCSVPQTVPLAVLTISLKCVEETITTQMAVVWYQPREELQMATTGTDSQGIFVSTVKTQVPLMDSFDVRFQVLVE